MKKILFASTALAGLAIGGMASAQGITLFGDARLGLGYNINNDGSLATVSRVETDDAGNEELVIESDEELRAVSRVRFGVRMTGETDSGITFGASIRADNSSNGQGSTFGQRAGDVFVSGAWGTLTFGDTAGADERNVGDVPGGVGITGLGDFNETFYFTNGGSIGDDNTFQSKPFARPTVRYDYAIAGANLSVSTDRNLADIAVGASYTFDFDAGSVTAGIGYAEVAEFISFGGAVVDPNTGLTVIDRTLVPEIEQISASLKGTFGGFTLGGVYSTAETDTFTNADDERIKGQFDTYLIGAEYDWNEWTFGGFYHKIDSASGGESLDDLDGGDAYGVGFAYDLGGGARVRAGYVNDVFDQDRADFGISMSF